MRREADLTTADISVIKGMAQRKDRLVDIAYYFEVPQTAVWRIVNAKRERLRKYEAIEAAPLEALPPKGPYKVVPVEMFSKLTDAAAVPVKLIEDLMRRLDALQRAVESLRIAKYEPGESDDGGRTPHVAEA